MSRYSPWRIGAAVLGVLAAAYVAVDATLAPYQRNAAGDPVSAAQLTQLYAGDAVVVGVAALVVLCVYVASRRD